MSVYVDRGFDGWGTGGLVLSIITIFALYLAYKRGAGLLEYLVAFFLSPLYIVYILIFAGNNPTIRL